MAPFDKSAACPAEGTNIPFPFRPYPSQKALMQQLYKVIDAGRIGLFESPTGTGKSLSLICASLAWLKDHQERQTTEIAEPIETISATAPGANRSATSDEPDWLRDWASNKVEQEKVKRQQQMRKRREDFKSRLRRARDKLLTSTSEPRNFNLDPENKRRNASKKSEQKSKAEGPTHGTGGDIEEDDLALSDYHSNGEEVEEADDLWKSSDGEAEGQRSNRQEGEYSKVAIDNSAEEEEEGDQLDRSATKILYCSRTHSQLSQFVMEMEKTSYHQNVSVIMLGARKNLCINEEVLRLGSDTQISDCCLDMQKGKAKGTTCAVRVTSRNKSGEPMKRQRAADKVKSKKCPYLQASSNQQAMFRDHALSRVRNLEDLAELGQKLSTCAYYGTRRAVAQAELICMPYSVLLHKSTRESMQVPIRGNVVLIDEAHNLIEAINAVYTNHLSLAAANRALSQVTLYWERYRSRFCAKNSLYVEVIIRILQNLVNYLGCKISALKQARVHAPSQEKIDSGHPTGDPTLAHSRIISVNDLLFEAQLDHVNLFKVVRYMEDSQIAKKVLGFAEHQLAEVQVLRQTMVGSGSSGRTEPLEAASEESEHVSSHISSLQVVQSFLTTLCGANADGRVVLETGLGPKKGRVPAKAGFKYIMLNAAIHFRQLIQEARSVILIGGTLQPVDSIIAQLFPTIPAERINVFSCGHVMPSENLVTVAITKGPSGVDMDFTHKARSSVTQVDALGQVILNISMIAPGGVVVFLPSYGYEEHVFARWRESGLIARLEVKRAIFREPKGAKDVDVTLQTYAEAVQSKRSETIGSAGGAILFCVVGAKMSEGINFADDMARCVIMVGLPYPDRRDPELQEKLAYLESSDLGEAPAGSQYRALCIRAVSQSIGRAIRHANDWAAIVLLDQRYHTDRAILPLLPAWIVSRLVPHHQAPDFGRAFSALNRFFQGRRAVAASPRS